MQLYPLQGMEMWDACEMDDAMCIDQLLGQRGFHINQTLPSGHTPLTLACLHGSVAIVDRLLACSQLQINKVQTQDGTTALYVAAAEGHAAVVAQLLQREKVGLSFHCMRCMHAESFSLLLKRWQGWSAAAS